MKVLHLSSEQTWRGGEQQIAYLVDELTRHKVSNYVACRSDSAFEVYAKNKNLNYKTLSFSGSVDLATARAIAKWVKVESIDLVHTHTAKGHGIASIATLVGLKTPIIVHRRVDFPIRQSWLTQWKYNRPTIKAIICVSHAIEQIARLGIKNQDKALTVHSGVDISRFSTSTKKGLLHKELGLPSSTKLIGNTSALAPHKNYGLFVEVAEKLIDRYEGDLHFVIIGDGDQRSAIEMEIEKRSLARHFTLTGFRKDIPDILPELDIFLMTSSTEGLGTSLIDALACKVPIVATEVGGIPEVVIHEKTGLTATVGDAQRLAENCMRLLDDEELQKEITSNGLKHLQSFTKESMATGVLEVYQKALKD